MEKWTMPNWRFQALVILVLIILVIVDKYIVKPENWIDYWKLIGTVATVLLTISFI